MLVCFDGLLGCLDAWIDAWVLGCLEDWMLECLDTWMLGLNAWIYCMAYFWNATDYLSSSMGCHLQWLDMVIACRALAECSVIWTAYGWSKGLHGSIFATASSQGRGVQG
jgi:hypothetical protein